MKKYVGGAVLILGLILFVAGTFFAGALGVRAFSVTINSNQPMVVTMAYWGPPSGGGQALVQGSTLQTGIQTAAIYAYFVTGWTGGVSNSGLSSASLSLNGQSLTYSVAYSNSYGQYYLVTSSSTLPTGVPESYTLSLTDTGGNTATFSGQVEFLVAPSQVVFQSFFDSSLIGGSAGQTGGMVSSVSITASATVPHTLKVVITGGLSGVTGVQAYFLKDGSVYNPPSASNGIVQFTNAGGGVFTYSSPYPAGTYTVTGTILMTGVTGPTAFSISGLAGNGLGWLNWLNWLNLLGIVVAVAGGILAYKGD